MTIPTRFSKEIWILAEHHYDILMRKFPDYAYVLHEDDTYLPAKVTEWWLQLVVSERGTTLLIASFSSSFVKVELSPFKEMTMSTKYGSGIIFANRIEVIEYADPKFTDNVLTNMLERLAR